MALMNIIAVVVSETGRERQVGLEGFRKAEPMRQKLGEACSLYLG
jgi:hypothetical protein